MPNIIIMSVPVTGLLLFFFTFLPPLQESRAASESAKAYVGTEKCRECHDSEYKNFTANARKAHSYRSVKIMSRSLTEAELKKCYECHTTGYGKEGGFRSEAETPHLKDAGCEVCHGPGGLHAASSDPKDIKGKLTAKDCESCHNPERVQSFRYKPLVYGGAH